MRDGPWRWSSSIRASARSDSGRFAEARADADRSLAVVSRLTDDPRALAYDRVLAVYALINRAIASQWLGDRPGAEKDLILAAQRARELMAAEPGNIDAKFAGALARSPTWPSS